MKDLKKLLKECHDLGELTEEFAQEASEKARICINLKTKDQYIRDESLSYFHTKIVRKWHMIDPTKSPFTFINRMAHMAMIDIIRKEKRHEEKKNILITICNEYKKKAL